MKHYSSEKEYSSVGRFKGSLFCLVLVQAFQLALLFYFSEKRSLLIIWFGSLASILILSYYREGERSYREEGHLENESLFARPYLVSSIDSVERARAIDDLYKKIRNLMGKPDVNFSEDVELKSLIHRLRLLQEEEANEMQRRFESSLVLRPGEGKRALRRAKDLLEKYEDSAISDSSAQ